MATLSKEEIRRKRIRKAKIYFFIFIGIIILSPLVAELLDGLLYGTFKVFGVYEFDWNYIDCVKKIFVLPERRILTIASIIVPIAVFVLSESSFHPVVGETKTIKVAEGIEIPVAVGNGQHGNARFQKEKEKNETYKRYEYSGNKNYSNPPKNSGIVIDYVKEGSKECIRYLDAAAHAIIIAATRRGKTRRVILPSVWLNILAGVNMALTDCKGEINLFTRLFAKARGYKEIVFDLSEPEYSMQYNYLKEIIDLLYVRDISGAVEKTWDLVSVLVGEAKGEKIWNDGECATIAAAILLVASDAPDECKNMTNVYYFLAYMCEADPNTGEAPINDYLDKLPYNHPARAAFQVAKIAPFRTRSSFFTSALATLRLFTDYKIADMTSKSDYGLDDIDNQKTIIYVIVPDEKITRYALGSLYINQVYEKLLEIAKKKGGRLDYRFEFLLDEFGNFPAIPGMGSKMSVAAGRNIFFRLVLQDYQQLQSKYKDDYKNIRTNADVTVFVGSKDQETLEHVSKECGTYTVEVKSSSSSTSMTQEVLREKKDSSSHSASSNMSSRPLLFPEEVKRIKSPDVLVLNGAEHPAIMNLPDISEYYANKEFGMGDVDHNRNLLQKRSKERIARSIREPKIWSIWDPTELDYEDLKEKQQNKKVSLM